MDLVKLAEDIVPELRMIPPNIPVHLSDERREAAKEILMDEESTATGISRAARMLMGQRILNWEPESVWLELRDLGVDIGDLNREKLLAMSCLLTTTAFYWDANAFENIALVLNNKPTIAEALQEASPAELSWAVYEAQLALQGDGQLPEFDYEPVGYAAVSLHREGFITAPEMLRFAQPILDQHNRGRKDLKGKVEDRWSGMDKADLDALELKETPEDIQIGHLASVWLYLQERAQHYRNDMLRLRL